MNEIELKARQLLAAHYNRAGQHGVAEGVRSGTCDGEPEMMALIQAMAEIPVDRESDRARYPDPSFNSWLDQSVSESGEYSVWHMLRSVHDAHSGWCSALAALAPEWQPIESAPKDGTFYLATNGKDQRVENCPEGHVAGIWHRIEGDWRGSALCDDSTHWQALPAPPEVEE